MDTFAAIALAAEYYPNSIIRQNEKNIEKIEIFTPIIWRSIFVMSGYIILLCLILLSFPKWFFGLDYENVELISNNSNKKEHFTIVFNVFIHAQLFNQINCRKVDEKGYNIFENILDIYKAFYFWFILILEFVVQFLIVQWDVLGVFFETTPLESHQYLMTVIYGSTVLAVGALIRALPESADHALKALYIAEHEDLSQGNQIMEAYNKHMDGKVDEDFFKKMQAHPTQPKNDDEEVDDGLFDRAVNHSNDSDDGFAEVK
jgi:magnesium-transporting ATPase (P-type)